MIKCQLLKAPMMMHPARACSWQARYARTRRHVQSTYARMHVHSAQHASMPVHTSASTLLNSLTRWRQLSFHCGISVKSSWRHAKNAAPQVCDAHLHWYSDNGESESPCVQPPDASIWVAGPQGDSRGTIARRKCRHDTTGRCVFKGLDCAQTPNQCCRSQ